MTYEEQQKQWIEENDVKVGDLVFIKGPFKDFTYRFTSGMKDQIGTVKRINDLVSDPSLFAINCGYCWPFYCLHKLTPITDEKNLIGRAAYDLEAKSFECIYKVVGRICGLTQEGSPIVTTQYKKIALLPPTEKMCYPPEHKHKDLTEDMPDRKGK